MLLSLPFLNELFRFLFPNRKLDPNRLRPTRVGLMLESLEQRLAPATLSDGGTAILGIALATGENLAIVSNGNSYTFTSNQNFASTSAADPTNQMSAFSGLGTNTLTLTSAGMAQYATGINITDAGANDTVTFNDSGANAYSNNFSIELSNPAAGAITFSGSSAFGDFNFLASTAQNIYFFSYSSLSTSAGNVTLQANQQAVPTSGDFVGILVNEATIQCTGTGIINLQGRGGSTGNMDYGVAVEAGGMISGGTSSLTINGTGGAAANSAGIWIQGADQFHKTKVTSNGGDVTLTGVGSGSGSGLYISSSVTAGVAGKVFLNGTGGAQGGTGIEIAGNVTSDGGDISVVGTGTGVGSGVSFEDFGADFGVESGVSAIGNASLNIWGTGRGGAGNRS